MRVITGVVAIGALTLFLDSCGYTGHDGPPKGCKKLEIVESRYLSKTDTLTLKLVDGASYTTRTDLTFPNGDASPNQDARVEMQDPHIGYFARGQSVIVCPHGKTAEIRSDIVGALTLRFSRNN